jgi:hypothetical protein
MRRRWTWALLVGGALGALAWLAACGAFTGTSDQGTGVATDASQPVESATGVDGATTSADAQDVMASDASAGGDAVADAGSTFCAQQDAAFCEDFDERDASFSMRWDNTGGTFALSNAYALSLPFSLYGEAPSGTPDGAYLEKDFTVQNSIDIELDVLFTSLPANSGNGRLCPLYIASSNGADVNFYVDDSQAYYQSGNNIYTTHTSNGPLLNAWHHVAITIDVTKTPAVATSLFDGTKLAWQGTGGLDQGYASPANVKVYVGATQSYMLPSAFPTYVDNVIVRVQ